MRHILIFTGLVGVTIVWLASAYMNFQYKIGLSGTQSEELVYGIIAVAFDVLKAILPIVLAWSLSSRKLFVTLIAGIMLLMLVPISVLSTMGVGARIKAQQSGIWMKNTEILSGLKSERKRKQQQLAGLQETGKTPASLKSEMRGLQQDRKWSRTKKCNDATASKSRKFCTQYFALEASLRSAEQAEKLDIEIGNLNRKIANVVASTVTKKGDAEAVMLADMIGLNITKIQTIKMVGVSIIVELISGMGFFVMLGHGGLDQRRKEKQLAKIQKKKRQQVQQKQKTRLVGTRRAGSGSVGTSGVMSRMSALLSPRQTGRAGEFASACVEYQKDARLSMSSFYEAYETWCKVKNWRAVSIKRFEQNIKALAKAHDWQTKQDQKELVIYHLVLKKNFARQLKAVA